MNNYKITFILFTFILLLGVSNSALADEIVHKFKNPSFSGVGTGAHYLTIENQEFSRKKAGYPAPWLNELGKIFPSVGRIDNVYGDRNLVCTCPPVSEYFSYEIG